MSATRIVQYRLSDGGLVGFWEGPAGYLDAQVPAEDATHGYVVLDETDELATMPSQALLAHYYVQEDMLVEKIAFTITATPNPFDADGETECAVTVVPFVACTLLVNGESVALTDADPVLEIVTETPEIFVIAVAPMVTHRADQITVEAI